MKIKEIVDTLNLRVLSGENFLDKEVQGAYCGDLLSWVMSHGNKMNAWITVQIHPNIIAVATLLEFSCVIVPEEIQVEEVTLEKSEQEGIPILQSADTAYTICGKLKDLGV